MSTVYMIPDSNIMAIPHPFFKYCNATVAVCIFSFVAYYVLGKIFLVNKGIGGFPHPKDKKQD